MNQDIHSDTFDLDDLEALGLSKFDPTQHLTSKAAVAAYMSEIVATGNAELFQAAMNDVVRAYGMGKVAARADITREGAYKALREGSKPRFETILKMLDALGMQLAIVPKTTPDGAVDTGLKKLGAILGDRVQTGCNSVTSPGTLIGPDSLLMPNATAPSGVHPRRSVIR